MRDVAEMRGGVRRHDIDQTTGEAAVFVVSERAWHGLGKVIAEAATSEEAIKLAGLDWEVRQLPLNATGGDGSSIAVPGWYANVRSDTKAVIGVVGEGYRVLQNKDAFSFMDSVIGAGEARYESAGSLRGGKRVWMLARIPESILASANDEILPYGLICNGHDGTLAVHLMPTSVRVCCWNTLNLALNNGVGRELVIRHSTSLKGRVNDAREKMGLVRQRLVEFRSELDALRGISVNDDQLIDYAKSVIPAPRVKKVQRDHGKLVVPQDDLPAVDGDILAAVLAQTESQRDAERAVSDWVEEESELSRKRYNQILETILQNYHDPKENAVDGGGTAWNAFNSISYWSDHERSVRGKNAEQKADNRLYSNWFGASNDIKQVAYSNALSMAR